MDFAWALDALRRGLKVTRKGWLLRNATMYLKMVKDAELKRDVARIFCMGRQASEWCPTQEQLFEFTDWEEYVEPKKEEHVHQDENLYFDYVCKGCFNCLWRKKGQTNCGGHPNLIKNAAGIVTECSSWIRRQDRTEDVLHGGQAVEDQSEHAKEARKAVTDEEHQKELLDTLVNAFAELVSQRVAQLLQDKKEPNHV